MSYKVTQTHLLTIMASFSISSWSLYLAYKPHHLTDNLLLHGSYHNIIGQSFSDWEWVCE